MPGTGPTRHFLAVFHRGEATQRVLRTGISSYKPNPEQFIVKGSGAHRSRVWPVCAVLAGAPLVVGVATPGVVHAPSEGLGKRPRLAQRRYRQLGRRAERAVA